MSPAQFSAVRIARQHAPKIRQIASILALAFIAGCGGERDTALDLEGQALQRSRRPLSFTPTAEFDWSMPPTIDLNGDNLVDMNPSQAHLNRKTFEVRLNGCASRPEEQSGPLNRFEWKIESFGSSASAMTIDSSNCDVLTALEQGGFMVTLTVTSPAGLTGTVRKQITVRNFLVVSIGDSNASGEGNPEVPGDGFLPIKTRWSDRRCHRSALGGPPKAARVLEDADSQSSVTFLSVACSGAGIDVGLLGPYIGQEFRPGDGPPLEPQPTQVRNLLCPDGCPNGMRTIDALLINVGANDVGFGTVVNECAFPVGDCQNGSVPAMVEDKLLRLPGKFFALEREIKATLKPLNVFIGEYFDPTWGDPPGVGGGWRGSTATQELCFQMVFQNAGFGFIEGVINNSEVHWARKNVVLPINAAVEQAAKSNGWNFVGNIADEFRGHGYCAIDNWVVRYDQSIVSQNNQDGTMHPNALGHDVYGRREGAALVKKTLVGNRRTDIDGDGNADILWFHRESGTVAPWFLMATSGGVTPALSFSTPLQRKVEGSSDWDVGATGDFDNDGKSDIFWVNGITGDLTIWYLDGVRVVRTADIVTWEGRFGREIPKARVPASSGWRVIGTGDFDRNGSRDILWYHGQTGTFSVWSLVSTSDGVRYESSKLISDVLPESSGWTPVGTGDFNHDGSTDILWTNRADGRLAAWHLNGFSLIGGLDLSQVGPTIATGWNVVSVDDFDRDGFDDLLWHHGPTGNLAIWHLFKNNVITGSTITDTNHTPLTVPGSLGWRVVSR